MNYKIPFEISNTDFTLYHSVIILFFFFENFCVFKNKNRYFFNQRKRVKKICYNCFILLSK